MANKNAAKKQQAKRAVRAAAPQPKGEVVEEVKTEQVEAQAAETQEVKETEAQATETKESKKSNVDNTKEQKDSKDQKKGKKKEKKPSKLVRKVKETGSELKKVTWPSFSTVVKNTGIVLAVVIFFTVVLFGFDSLLGWIYSLFTKNL